jgi:hypothetical protein
MIRPADQRPNRFRPFPLKGGRRRVNLHFTADISKEVCPWHPSRQLVTRPDNAGHFVAEFIGRLALIAQPGGEVAPLEDVYPDCDLFVRHISPLVLPVPKLLDPPIGYPVKPPLVKENLLIAFHDLRWFGLPQKLAVFVAWPEENIDDRPTVEFFNLV